MDENIRKVTHVQNIRYDKAAERLYIIDQTLLPNEEREIELRTIEEMVEAIKKLRIRGAPAIGICAAGTGISAVVFSSILSALIGRFSLRVCFYVEALVSLLAAIAVFLLIRETPEACGLAPYGTREEASSSEKQKRSIHPSRLRWAMLYLGVILIGSIASPGFAHMMILFTSSGFSGAQAAFSFMPGAIADLTGSYAPAYIVFTLFAIFTLAVVQSTYRLERRSAV